MLVSDELKLILNKPILAKILCAIAIILLLLQFISFFSSIKNAIQTKYDDGVVHIENLTLNKEKIKEMMNIPIFGKYIPKQLDDANIRPSLLNLHVIGVMFSKNKQNSQVIIRFTNGIERTFKIGDIIPGGATILHISVDGVIVTRDGVLERLNLPKSQLIFDKPLKPLK